MREWRGKFRGESVEITKGCLCIYPLPSESWRWSNVRYMLFLRWRIPEQQCITWIPTWASEALRRLAKKDQKRENCGRKEAWGLRWRTCIWSPEAVTGTSVGAVRTEANDSAVEEVTSKGWMRQTTFPKMLEQVWDRSRGRSRCKQRLLKLRVCVPYLSCHLGKQWRG